MIKIMLETWRREDVRGHEVTVIRRHISRFMKDSLTYRGSILWNLVNYNEKINNVGFKETAYCRGLFQRFYFLCHSCLYVETQSQRLCVFLNFLVY